MIVDEENRSVDLTIHYWGPFKSGKSTSLAYIRSRVMKIDFVVDDAPFVPSAVAARSANPMAILGGFWRTPPLSKVGNGFDLHARFRDASGFPANVALEGLSPMRSTASSKPTEARTPSTRSSSSRRPRKRTSRRTGPLSKSSPRAA